MHFIVSYLSTFFDYCKTAFSELLKMCVFFTLVLTVV